MKNLVAVILCGACAWTGVGAGTVPDPLASPQAAVNYSLGYQLGRDLVALKDRGTPPDLEMILRGLSDALAGAEPSIGNQGVGQALADLRQQGAGTAAERRRFEARTTSAFQALHAGQDGVVTLPSGLQYLVLAAGNGRQPTDGDTLTLNYMTTLADGVQVDSTYEDGEPARLRLSEVSVSGLREALALMSPGARWKVYVPPALGFSEYSPLRDRALIFEVELLEVAPPTEIPPAAANPH